MQLYRLSKPELDKLRENANLTDDEEIIYNMLAKGKSIVQIADKLNLSTRTIDRRIRNIKNKIK